MKIEIAETPPTITIDDLRKEVKSALQALHVAAHLLSFTKFRIHSDVETNAILAFDYAVEGRPLKIDFTELTRLILFCSIAKSISPLADCPEMIKTAQVLRTVIARKKIDCHDNEDQGELNKLILIIDECDHAHLDHLELAALANMNSRAVMNALRGMKEIAIKLNYGSFGLTIKDASLWLRQRNGFIPTMLDQASETLEYVTVPVARDGTYFCRSCKQKNGYRVGDKGNELTFEDISEALTYLKSMKIAKWRRPNPNGNFGIVSGIEWRSISIAEFNTEKCQSRE